MVYGAWSVAQTKDQLKSPKLRTLVAPSCLRLSHSTRTSWTAGRLRLSELLVPSRLPCLRKSRFLSGTVRTTLFSSGRPSRRRSFSSALRHALMRIMPYSLSKNRTQNRSTCSILDKFDKTSVIQSLRNMDQTRNNLSSTTSAFLAAPHPLKHPQKPSTSYTVPSTTPTPSSSQNRGANCPKCDFCSRLGHLEAKCFLREKLMRQISLSSPATAAPASTSPQTAAHAVPEAPQSASIASVSAHSSVTSPDAHIASPFGLLMAL